MLTSQSCEFTVTAVGEVKVLVLHGARKLLADCCATKSTKMVATKLVAPSRLAAARLGKGLEEEAGREVNEPSTAPLPPADPRTKCMAAAPDAPLDPSTQLRQRRVARVPH